MYYATYCKIKLLTIAIKGNWARLAKLTATANALLYLMCWTSRTQYNSTPRCCTIYGVVPLGKSE